MSFPNGKPPLHRRADPKSALRHIRRRYQRCREVCHSQVAALQHEPEFLRLARTRYTAGYKDWHLAACIANAMMNAVLREREIDVRPYRSGSDPSPQEMMDAAAGRVFPTALFLGEKFDLMMILMETSCLATLGFEMRNPKVDPQALHRFLLERIDFYSHDLPHQPLFGEPLGDWPDA